jgi:WD40 repeat protein
LLERLIEKRLLVKGGRTGSPPESAVTIEVAHEALLRRWPTLTTWLSEDAFALKRLEAVERAAAEWTKNRDQGEAAEAWLIHTGERLTAAEALRRRPDFERQLGDDGRAYLVACRARDDRVRQEREERLRQIQAERDRAEEERAHAESEAENARRAADIAEQARHRATARTRLAVGALCVVVLTSVLTGLFYKRARDSQEQAKLNAESAARQARLALSSSLASQSQYYADKRLDQSVLLALAAVAVEPIVEARSALLSALLDNPKLRVFLHDDVRVNAVAVDSAGALLATAGEDGQVRLWSVALAKPYGDPLQHSGAVTAVAFDPSGQRIASATAKGEVILWDTESRKRLVTMARKHDGRADGLAFSPDGELIASAGSDRTVRLWSPATGEPAGSPLTSFTDRVTSVAFSPDGRTLGSGTGDGGVVLWDMTTRQSTPLKKVHNFPVTTVAFDAGSTLFASGSRDGSVAIWEVNTRKLRDQLVSRDRRRPVTAIAFSSRGATLAVGADDGTIEIWDVSARDATRLVTTLTGHREPVSALAFGPSSQLQVSASLAGPTVLWDLQRESRIAEPLQVQPSAVNAIAFGGAQDELLAIGERDGSIRVWDAAARRFGPSSITTDGEVRSLAISRDGKLLASGSIYGRVSFWDGDSGKRLGEPLSVHTGAVTAVVLSLDGKTLATASEDRKVLIWDASARKPRGEPLQHNDWVRAIALSPDARKLAAAVNDGTVLLWDATSGKAIGELSAHDEAVIAVAFSTDGKWLTSGGYDQSAILWNLETRQPLGAPLAGHKGVVSAVAFTADLLATAGSDGATILWDLGTRKQLGRPLSLDDYPVTSIAFSRDGKRLAAGSESGRAILWNVDPDAWRELACQVANRNLSCREWRQFLDEEPYGPLLCAKLPGPADMADCRVSPGQAAAAGRQSSLPVR